MPNSDFKNQEAIDMNLSKKYDIVLSHSVFHYFKDLDYAENVIKKMIDKSNNQIAIFDINDELKKDAYHRVRMGDMTVKEYEEKYKGLEHMFYSKEWFYTIAEELDIDISIFNQTFKNYTNSSLRFNVIMKKRLLND